MESFDIIFDTVGKISSSNYKKTLTQNWKFVTTNRGMTKNAAEDLVFLKETIEAGKIKSVIDRCYPLEQVADAHRYVEKGHKKGNVIITLEH